MSFWNKLQTHLHEAVKAAEATAKDAAAVAKDAAAVVKSEYKQTFEDQFTQIFEVIPGKLIVMEYPMGEKIHKVRGLSWNCSSRRKGLLNMIIFTIGEDS